MPDIWILMSLMGIGAVAGFLAGLLGVGGGLIIVPALVWVLEQGGFQQHVQHLALGTSLAVMVFTSFSSVRAHHKHGAVDWNLIKKMALPMIIGTLLGSQVAGFIPSMGLKWFFVIYAYTIAAQTFFNLRPEGGRPLPNTFGLWCVGSVIGIISSFVGIGGGSMSVPFLTWCRVPIQKAIANSAALGWPIAVSGTIGYIFSGVQTDHLPPFSVGFVYLPGLITLSIVTTLMAPIGAKVAHKLPVSKLKKAFAFILVITASEMLWKLLQHA